MLPFGTIASIASPQFNLSSVEHPCKSRKRMSPEKTCRRRKQLIKRDGVCCHYCNKPLIEQQMTLDHKHPFALGGDDSLENLVIACLRCNREKGNQRYEDYQRFRSQPG